MTNENMADFYAGLVEENVLDYGRKTEHLDILSDLYTDDSHFIFEILQNAEDAQASGVKFVLYPDKLEIFHDGKRLFDEKDVRSITKISASTKKDDVNTTGKFGLGFKSVYSVTDAPEIHSGIYDFKIESLIRPYPIKHRDIPSPYTTLFILPFKAEKKEQVYDKLSQKLQKLELRTVLFLSNIKSISWEIKGIELDKNSGIYLKEDKINCDFGFKEVTCLDDERLEKWFVFSDGTKEDCFIELAFMYDDKNKEIIPAENTDLVVLFPTEKETGLNFVVNGNFLTTPARDNIPPEKEHNKQLVVHVQNLLKNVILDMTSKGLMNVSLMKTLPTDKKQFNAEKRAFFRPIYDTVKELFKEYELIPTIEQNVYAKAGDIVVASSSDLTEIYTPYHKKWLLTSITRNNKNSDLFYFLTEDLNVPVITPLQFCEEYLSKEYLVTKDDEWFKRFYAFLADDKTALWRENTNSKGRPSNAGIVRSKPIIRLENNELVTPDEGAFLPTGTTDSDYQTVKHCFAEDSESYEFLKRLGLKQPNMVDALEKNVLQKYKSKVELSDEEYLKDIRKIISVLQSSDVTDNERQRIKEYSFIKCQDGEYKKPFFVYQDTPELRAWFGKQERAYVAECIKNEELSILGVVDFPHWNPVLLKNEQIPTKIREENRTKTQDDEFLDIEIDGLEGLEVTTDNAIVVASIILKVYKKFGTKTLPQFETSITIFNGLYTWIRNRRCERTAPTRVLTKLQNIDWVLTKDGRLENPMHISMEQIHQDVMFLTELPECVFGSDLKQSLISQLEQMGTCPVLCNTPEEAEAARRAVDELRTRNKKQQDSVESDVIEESWTPDVDVADVEIEEGIMRFVAVNRGETGFVTNTKHGEMACDNEVAILNQRQEDFSEKDKQKIGEYGEKAVKRYLIEIEKIPESEITILNTSKENSTGRDIEITKNGELVRYIEVKSTTEIPPCHHRFETSGKQWEVARKQQDKYWLYCVFGVGSEQVTILPIQNPNKQWRDGRIEADPVNFVIKA